MSKNQDQMDDMEGADEDRLEDLESNIRYMDRVMKQLELYEKNYDNIVNNSLVSFFPNRIVI